MVVSCSKKDATVVPNNKPKSYDDVSTVKVENYINRIYIDLLGREPLDAESIRDLELLRKGNLSINSRQRYYYEINDRFHFCARRFIIQKSLLSKNL
jgi:hypothetical protein